MTFNPYEEARRAAERGQLVSPEEAEQALGQMYIEDQGNLFRVRNRLVKTGLARYDANDDGTKQFVWTEEGERVTAQLPTPPDDPWLHEMVRYAENVERVALEDQSYREKHDAMMRFAREERDAMMRAAKWGGGHTIDFAELAKHPKDGYDDPAEEEEVQRLNDESRSEDEDFLWADHEKGCYPETCKHVLLNSAFYDEDCGNPLSPVHGGTDDQAVTADRD